MLPEYIFGRLPCVLLLHKENRPIFYKHLTIRFDQDHDADKSKQPHQTDFSGTSFLTLVWIYTGSALPMFRCGIFRFLREFLDLILDFSSISFSMRRQSEISSLPERTHIEFHYDINLLYIILYININNTSTI